ncbi:trace amine-associated receptor 1-like [Labrus bergylta]|uniref:trace amine-associated receptor 1-like n=1 Tax=Labrus bergylta TaxID=56723 RepID=UPI0033144679
MGRAASCTLNHILTGCPKALAEGQYRWRHDKVLTEIVKWVEQQRVKANNKQAQPPEAITFVREGDKAHKTSMVAKNPPSTLQRASDWELRVDLKRKLVFPQDVAVTSHRPDMVLLSRSTKTIIVAELRVPWEERLATSHQLKKAKYQDLVDKAVLKGWHATSYPTEVGSGEFPAKSMEPERCFESRNTSCLKSNYPIPLRVTLYIIFGVIIILTVCGNLLVTFSVACFKQLHTPTNYLIFSLAVSDLLLGIIVMFPGMIRFIETCWYFGDFFFDRYYAVCQPLLYRSKISVNVVLILILLCWSFSVLVGFGMIFLKLNILCVEEFYYNHVACEGGCVVFMSGVSSTVSSVINFYFPGIIMLCVYLKIYLVARRQFCSIQNAGCVNSVKTSNTSQTKATKTLAIVMGGFLCFWSPFFVCNIINPFVSYSIPPTFFVTLVWLGFLNSAVNPIIYAFFYSWFRKAFKLLTSGNIFKSDISETTLFND